MIEGFIAKEHVKVTNAGSMPKRIDALKKGDVAAVSLMEPWISVAETEGLRVLMESHSTRAEAAGDDLDGPTLAKIFRAQARACEDLDKDPTPYIHYFVAETGGRLRGKGLPASEAPPCSTAALYAGTLGRYLQLDGQLEHDGTGCDLRQDRLKPRFCVNEDPSFIIDGMVEPTNS